MRQAIGIKSDKERFEPALAHSIDGLQYLRAVAALMVVFHHARWLFPADCILNTAAWSEFGSRGVDIFFVISGFVMAYSTRSFDPAGSRPAQAADFLVKRLIRVVPLYWVATLWTARRIIWHGNVDLDLVKDFLFLPRFHEHDHGMVWPIVFQGWTINYEMFFYALFALAMLAGRLRFLALSLALLALTLLGVLASFTHANTNSAAIIFYTSNLLVEFLMGVWLCLWMRGHSYRPSRVVLGGIAAIGFALISLPNSDLVRGFADGIAATMIVWSTVLWSDGVELPRVRRLGDASYSIYLFHMTFFGASKWLLGSIDLLQPTAVNMVIVIPLYLVAASALGILAHRTVERPMLSFFGSLRSRRIRSVTA